MCQNRMDRNCEVGDSVELIVIGKGLESVNAGKGTDGAEAAEGQHKKARERAKETEGEGRRQVDWMSKEGD